MFDLIGHEVKRVAEIAELGAAGDIDAFGEVAGSDAMSAGGELVYRVREFFREEDSGENG